MNTSVSLAQLILEGGVYSRIAGANRNQILTVAIDRAELPGSIDRASLLKAVLEREQLMPTSLGHGIAAPHPRNPIIQDTALQRVCVFYLEKPMAWNAMDGIPVHCLFLIISATTKDHLSMLSMISYFSQNTHFRALLEKNAVASELVEPITQAEQDWMIRSPT